MTVSAEVSNCERVCCRLCAMLSMSLVTRLEELATRLGVEVGQRESAQLGLDVAAQAIDRAVDDQDDDAGLDPREQARHGIQGQGQQQDVADGGEVHALPRADVVHRGEHVGEFVVTAGAQALDGLRLGGPGRDLLAEQPGEDQVGGPAEDLGTEGSEDDADQGEGQRDPDLDPVGAHEAQEPLGGGLEVLRLLGRLTHPHVRGPGALGTAGRTAARLGSLLLLGQDAITHFGVLEVSETDPTLCVAGGAKNFVG